MPTEEVKYPGLERMVSVPMVHIARTGTLALLGALLLLPSASAISLDLLGQGRVDVAEDKTACVTLHPAVLDALFLAAAACADATEEGLDVTAGAAASAADIHAVAMASADAGPGGVHAGAAAAADAAGTPIHAAAAADADEDPHLFADAKAGDLRVGPVTVPDDAAIEEPQGMLARIGSWLRGIF